jgi:hypothetical protein
LLDVMLSGFEPRARGSQLVFRVCGTGAEGALEMNESGVIVLNSLRAGPCFKLRISFGASYK